MDTPRSEPSFVRVGISLGSTDDGLTMATMCTGLNDLAMRMLNIMRLVILALPIVHQSCYLHSVDFLTWLARLAGSLACVGVLVLLVSPEQMLDGMALKRWRWIFDLASSWSGGAEASDTEDRCIRLPLNELGDQRVRLRWHSTSTYLSVDRDGFAVPAAQPFAITVRLRQIEGKGVADTYRLQLDEPTSRFHRHWLSFSSVNQLRTGGWLRAYTDVEAASPYKLVWDSGCPPGACKLLCAWPGLPPVSRRYCTGFYLAEQLHGGDPWVGHAPDADAARFELLAAPEDGAPASPASPQAG